MHATVCKIIDFPAAHSNGHHSGHCQNVHGHTWTLEIHCRGKVNGFNEAEDYGMVVDFGVIKNAYKEYIEPLVEHQNLNETLDLPEYTTEYIAHWIFQTLQRHIPLYKVRLWEGKTSFAEITNGDMLR